MKKQVDTIKNGTPQGAFRFFFICNILPLLSGSGDERRQQAAAPKSRSTGLVSQQPEIVARNMATPKSVQQNARGKNPLALKVLKVLRGLLLKKSPKWGLGQSPKVFLFIPLRLTDGECSSCPPAYPRACADRGGSPQDGKPQSSRNRPFQPKSRAPP